MAVDQKVRLRFNQDPIDERLSFTIKTTEARPFPWLLLILAAAGAIVLIATR